MMVLSFIGSLVRRRLYYNELTGTMPTELGLLTMMEDMYVQRETLTLTLTLLYGFSSQDVEVGCATRCHRGVYHNAGLYDCVVYPGGRSSFYLLTEGTALGACSTSIANSNRLERCCSSPPPPPPSPPPAPPAPVEVQAQAVTPPASLASRPTAAVALLATMATLAALLMA